MGPGQVSANNKDICSNSSYNLESDSSRKSIKNIVVIGSLMIAVECFGLVVGAVAGGLDVFLLGKILSPSDMKRNIMNAGNAPDFRRSVFCAICSVMFYVALRNYISTNKEDDGELNCSPTSNKFPSQVYNFLSDGKLGKTRCENMRKRLKEYALDFELKDKTVLITVAGYNSIDYNGLSNDNFNNFKKLLIYVAPCIFGECSDTKTDEKWNKPWYKENYYINSIKDMVGKRSKWYNEQVGNN